ncbi:MAG TPA: disulfide bond formation protein B [Candidatus Paceibacterota bacterium]
MKSFIAKYNLYLIFGVSLLAMLGSLFFSEVMDLPPCVLCWYQRIALYPMVILSAIAIYKKSREVYSYMLGLLIPGFLISLYHNLLYYKILPESVSPCTAGVSCTTKFFEWFGFITIPLLAFAAFVILILLVVKGKNRQSN